MNLIGAFIRYLIFATALTPIVVFRFLPFPYNFSQALFFRVAVEVIVILFLVYIWLAYQKGQLGSLWLGKFKAMIRNSLFRVVLVFLGSAFFSTVLANNTYYAFWGNAERGEGFYGLAHYFLFIMVAILFLKKEDWISFFKISLVVGFLMVLCAWFQYWGVTNFSFVLTQEGRPGSFLGNPAFLSEYLILLVAFSGIVFYYSFRSRIWRYLSALLVAIIIPTLFISNTRGALVGLLAGLIFWLLLIITKGRQYLVVRRVALGFLVAVIFGMGTFWATRQAPVWQEVPGLSRLAEIGVSDSSVQTRLIALGVSWQAFKERPLLGWGLENYKVAYNKYYNPEYARYEAAWFDRAHNKVAEMGVTQGLVGLLSYLAIFVVLFYLFFKKRFFLDSGGGGWDKKSDQAKKVEGKNNKIGLGLGLILSAVLVAYFVQNLFLFDTPVSGFMFFSIMAFVAGMSGAAESEIDIGLKKSINPNARRSFFLRRLILGLLVLTAIIVVFYSLYFYNYIPARQSWIYRRAADTGVGEKIVDDSPRFLEPYNFIQPTLRFQLLETSSKGNILRDPVFTPLVSLAIESMEEVVKREPDYEPRELIILAETYNEKGKDDPELLKKSEGYLRKALILSPRRQDIFYILAFTLAGQGRFEEAVGVAREAVALDSGVGKAHYNLGLELALAGQDHWDEAEKELGVALDINFVGNHFRGFTEEDYKNIVIIYKKMLEVYIPKRDEERVLRIVKRLKQVDLTFGEDMDIIADLVQKNQWDILIASLNSEGN